MSGKTCCPIWVNTTGSSLISSGSWVNKLILVSVVFAVICWLVLFFCVCFHWRHVIAYCRIRGVTCFLIFFFHIFKLCSRVQTNWPKLFLRLTKSPNYCLILTRLERISLSSKVSCPLVSKQSCVVIEYIISTWVSLYLSVLVYFEKGLHKHKDATSQKFGHTPSGFFFYLYIFACFIRSLDAFSEKLQCQG